MKVVRVPSLLVALLGAVPHAAPAQDAGPLERAAALTAAGDLASAEALYDSLITAGATDAGIFLARGHVRAWRGNPSGAQSDFGAVLARDPTNLSAHVGRGFAHAWSGEFDAARASFERARRLAPASAEPARALAYVALWSGRAREAAARFDSLAAADPNDADLVIARGQALLAAGYPAGARRAFRRALDLDPTREDARSGLLAAHFAPTPLQLSVLAGYTSFTGTADSRLGLRYAEVTAGIRPGLRLALRYDNGLALDNRALASAGDNVPNYTGGVVVAWAGRLITHIEAGWRDLPGTGQRTVALEQAVVLGPGAAVKTGVWIGDRSGLPTEWLASGGLAIAVGPRLRVEPTVFVSGGGPQSPTVVRGLLVTTVRPAGGAELSVGFAYGRSAIASSRTGNVGEGFVTASLPVVGPHRTLLSIRHQRSEGDDDMTVVSLGFSLGLLGR